jgi:hypothetical protein
MGEHQRVPKIRHCKFPEHVDSSASMESVEYDNPVDQKSDDVSAVVTYQRYTCKLPSMPWVLVPRCEIGVPLDYACAVECTLGQDE